MKQFSISFISFRTLVEREIIRFTSVFSQTIFPPLVSSFLFISVFGYFLGGNLNDVQGMPYLKFLVPGLVMMYLIESSYMNTSTSLFIARWMGHIQEILVTPLSYIQMVLAMIIGGIVRAFVVAGGVYLVSLIFEITPIVHPWIALYFAVFVTVAFASAGLITGLLAEEWEQLSIWTSFVITPLIYLGGVFHSVQMAPPFFRMLTHLNPIFYMINGMRYGMLGVSDAPVGLSMLVVFVFSIFLFSITVILFKKGYKLRK